MANLQFLCHEFFLDWQKQYKNEVFCRLLIYTFHWLFIHVSFPLFNVSIGSGGNKNAPELDPSRSYNSKQFQTKPKVN